MRKEARPGLGSCNFAGFRKGAPTKLAINISYIGRREEGKK